jgi:hypothetical protein
MERFIVAGLTRATTRTGLFRRENDRGQGVLTLEKKREKTLTNLEALIECQTEMRHQNYVHLK